MISLYRYILMLTLQVTIGCYSCFSQKSAAAVLADFEKNYTTNDSYDLALVYTMYKGFTGHKITEQYKGSLYKEGTTFRMTAMENEVVQFDKKQLNIDHQTKQIYIRNKVKEVENPTHIVRLLQYYAPVTMQTKGDRYIIEMAIKNSQLPLPFQKMRLHIHKETKILLKQTLFFAQKQAFVTTDGNELDTARLEIEIEEQALEKRVSPITLSDYVITENSGYIAADNYKNYNIIDQTNR